MAAKKETVKKAVKTPTVEKHEEVQTEEVKTPQVKKPLSIPDYVRLVVQSNVYGQLIYVNGRTGDTFLWDNFGDYQALTMGDLRAMRGSQNKFFSNNYIFIDHVEEEGYQDVTPEEVYKLLGVSQYYKDILSPENFTEIFTLSESEMRKRLLRLGVGAKTNVIVAANEAIKRGDLDSLKKIRMIEELLNCELMSNE